MPAVDEHPVGERDSPATVGAAPPDRRCAGGPPTGHGSSAPPAVRTATPPPCPPARTRRRTPHARPRMRRLAPGSFFADVWVSTSTNVAGRSPPSSRLIPQLLVRHPPGAPLPEPHPFGMDSTGAPACSARPPFGAPAATRRGGWGTIRCCAQAATRVDQDQPAPTPDPPRRSTLAGPGRSTRALPRRVCLHRRATPQRHYLAAVPPALRRLGQHLRLRDLPGQPRRIRRLHPAQRTTRRQPRRSPRLRLRALPQRPHRLAPTPTN